MEWALVPAARRFPALPPPRLGWKVLEIQLRGH